MGRPEPNDRAPARSTLDGASRLPGHDIVVTIRLRTKPTRCPGCGAVAVEISNPRQTSQFTPRGSRSGVYASDRIILNGRQIYGEGQEIEPEDIERLGLDVLGEVGTLIDRTPAPRQRDGSRIGSLCFVIPAYQRIDLSTICFAQIADACATMRKGGLDARVVVIADDENLDLAEEHGFATIRHANKLGAKFNAGYAHALEAGYDWVAPLGSDSFIDPNRYLDYKLPGAGEMFCTRNYTAVHSSGTRHARLWIGYEGGIGTRVFPTEMLRVCGHMPIEPGRPSGCDTATLGSLKSHQRVRCLYTNLSPFEIVGFQTKGTQITAYANLRTWMTEEVQGFAGIEEYFPAKYVKQIKRHYSSVA